MDFLKVSVIVLFVILTLLTLKIHPEMHQPMMIEDADFVLTRISDTLTTENAPVTVVQKPVEKSVQIVQETPKTERREVILNIPQDTKTEQQVKTVKTQTPEKSQSELLARILKNQEQPKYQENPNPIDITKIEFKTSNQLKEQPKEQPKQEVQPKVVEQPKSSNPYMTEQEEIIAWNKWRSDVQNEIMRQSKLETSALGSKFEFSFIVDKFGNVSNIKVDCTGWDCNYDIKNGVKPAIAGLQKKPILNFPKGTRRTSTVFTGYFYIGLSENLSNPSFYSDYERITH